MAHPLTDIQEYEPIVEEYPLVGGCKERSHALHRAIQRDAPSASIKEGYIRCHNGLEPHVWVEAFGIDIEGVGRGEDIVILDAALHQFTEDRFECGDVAGYIPNADNRGPIAVIHEDAALFERYAR